LKVLDLATGTGDQIVASLETDRSFHSFVGIDLAESMMEIGREKLRRLNPSCRVVFQKGDAQALPFPDASFDAATLSFGIRNIPDPRLALAEAYRVLKPWGRLVVLEFANPHRWLRPFYLWYLRRVMPRLGGALSRNEAAYRYLHQSIEEFPSGDEFLRLLREAQFSSLSQRRMNGGGVAIYSGDKCISV
jgi:demethylmenaquinone methyltransferase/2-methoxy-6-polyprenyl-1,4-benzoquinol methylase